MFNDSIFIVDSALILLILDILLFEVFSHCRFCNAKRTCDGMHFSVFFIGHAGDSVGCPENKGLPLTLQGFAQLSVIISSENSALHVKCERISYPESPILKTEL